MSDLPKILDVGCGSKKRAGSHGVDVFPFPGVDQVFDFEAADWPLPQEHFDEVYIVHVIEHVRDIKHFLQQVHRVCAHGARVYFETPHFSCIESWSDVTHTLHLSSRWHNAITKGGYLIGVIGEYELVSSELEFAPGWRGWLAKLTARIVGKAAYERHYAFMLQALNVRTWLKVKKH